MSVITGVKQGNTMELKNNSLVGGLNLMFETHYADMDGTATGFTVTTAFKQVLGYIITQLSGTTVPMGFSSTLIPDANGLVSVDAIHYKTSDDTLAVLAADVNLKVILFGLSY